MPLVLATLFSGWAFFLLTPLTTLLVCFLLAAIAGRHLFLYNVLFSWFYAIGAVLTHQVLDPIEWEHDGIFLPLCFIITPMITLLGATPLYFLWKAKE